MDNKVLINFSKFPFCFRCTKVKKYDFTNYLSKSDEFFDNFKLIFEQLIPYVVSKSFHDLNREKNNQCHRIHNNTKEYDIVKEVIKNLCMEYRNFKDNSEFEMWFNQNINDYEIWQLGAIGGVRLIGIRDLNEFGVLFIDYHHLVYKDIKHNQKNCDKNDFCPIKNYKKELVK